MASKSGLSKSHHYCAFCGTAKKFYAKLNLSLIQIILIGTLSTISSFLIRGQWDEYILYIFFANLLIGELVSKLRFRTSLKCLHCGFDPVLYRRNPTKARDQVRIILQARKENPESILKAPLRLPQISKERYELLMKIEEKFNTSQMADGIPAKDMKSLMEINEAKSSTKGRILSKQI